MPTLASILMLIVFQSAPAHQTPPSYTVPALGPSRALVDANGNPIGFVDMGVFYTWSGTPVAYHQSGHDIYRFDGKHLGWWQDWRVHDHDGRVVMVAAPRSEYPKLPRGNKDLLPAKGPTERAPTRPPLTSERSLQPAREFFGGGKQAAWHFER